MPVSAEAALSWERAEMYYVNTQGINLPPQIEELVIGYFVDARTKSWTAHLADYFNSLPEQDNLPNDKSSSSSSSSTDTLQSALASCRRLRIGTEFHGFLDLPREIRDQIYRHALVKGKVAVPNRHAEPLEAQTRHQAWKIDYWRRETGEPLLRYEDESLFGHGLFAGEPLDPPSLNSLSHSSSPFSSPSSSRGTPLGLLHGVSSIIHAEAATIFFAHNQIILPAGRWRHPIDFREARMSHDASVQAFLAPSGARPSPILNAALLARDVSYTFDMRDAEMRDWEALHFCQAVKEQVDDQTIAPRDALAALHDQKTVSLEIMWAERIDAVKRMTLDRLQLCFDDCYCPVGCCRKVGWVLARFLDSGPLGGADAHDQAHVYSTLDWAGRPPKVVEVMGWVNEAERDRIRELLARLPGANDAVVRFMGYSRRPGIGEFLIDDILTYNDSDL
ncbi:hypothetical protein M406DRAFT_349379 [Cryphonectria parasitica EP155]|uniref:Uncharacterized protein n=1 Tax=Cryphonectria parasitica (strain ATCC 38755 / EP155) TaxID=660469 RepID=A0A9P5CUL3_CRYP1|nr:uncharacterized protein M406DRAFT_349379 [Cryphonectria parasitica EP155]KAF3770762.1 hypothetical protein M406DRAFT_349379 [Cryphonectria parasitica EP155]